MADSSALSPEPPTPDSPHMTPVHSPLPPLESRVSGYKQNCVCWPFKWIAASLAISPWQTETLLLFTSGCFVAAFIGSVALGWGAWLGV